jgi:hypothetical protein
MTLYIYQFTMGVPEEWARRIRNAKLRPEDVLEIETVNQGTPANEAVLTALRASEYAAVVCEDAEPLVYYGVASIPGVKMGRVWAAGTTDSMSPKNIKTLWFDMATEEINKLGELYGALGNFIDSRNTKHTAWLKSMGFSFTGAQFIAPGGSPYLWFEKFWRI